jgi:hypothetical protein
MKSVVVEGSTVAKAIELAWQKAEKPEEFFIRILQEHSNGFLGFGAQKAKIVLFFKNTQKSDANFPSVLKQKEYASLFDNKNLKNPEVANVVDTQMNKNVHNQQQPKKKNNQAQNSVQHPAKKTEQPKQVTLNNVKNQHKKEEVATPVHQVAKPQHQQKKNDTHHSVQPKQVAQVVQKQQPIAVEKAVERKVEVKQNHIIEKKDAAAHNVTQALKKVQSQKIIANVSKKTEVVLSAVEKKTEPLEVVKISAQATTQPLRFKRRQLQVEEGQVSGITFSSDSDEKNSVFGLSQDVEKVVTSQIEEPIVRSVIEHDLQNMVDKAADLVKNIQPMKEIVFSRDISAEKSFDADMQRKKDL